MEFTFYRTTESKKLKDNFWLPEILRQRHMLNERDDPTYSGEDLKWSIKLAERINLRPFLKIPGRD